MRHVPFPAALASLSIAAFLVCPAAALICGQPVTTGSAPSASDALFVLRVAVGTGNCDPCVCNVDSSGGASPITASDALRVLRRAVGQSIELVCPPCECTLSEAPACGGTCPAGTGCVPSDGACVCRNFCELSEAPTCGGSCEFAAPAELECHGVTVTVGSESKTTCACLTPGAAVCGDADAPACGGVCRPASTCVQDGDGGWVCEELPVQGSCASATAPACGGTCGADLICIDEQGECACADASSHEESCSEADAPTCTGACPSGRICATALGACECFESCDVSAPPTCGGECDAPEKHCVAVTASFGGSDFNFCQCR